MDSTPDTGESDAAPGGAVGAAPPPQTMRAVVIEEPGASPRVRSVVMPARSQGQTLIKVVAAALNPLDLGMAAGLVPQARHEQPYVPGVECVGVVQESERFEIGTLVYAEAHPSPARPGTFASYLAASDDDIVTVPGGVDLDPRQAVAVGNAGVAAFLPLIDRAGLRAGESVLVLGATGMVGQLAVQIAKAHGAGRVVAVGRDEDMLKRTRQLGADATVRLVDGETAAELAHRLGTAVGSQPPNVVLDAIYGTAFEAALQVCAPGARIVNVGNFGGDTVVVPAALLRGRQLTIGGFASFLTPLPAKRRALDWEWGALAEGELEIEVAEFAVDDIAEAWQAQAHSPHAKIVITFADA